MPQRMSPKVKQGPRRGPTGPPSLCGVRRKELVGFTIKNERRTKRNAARHVPAKQFDWLRPKTLHRNRFIVGETKTATVATISDIVAMR